MAIQSKGLARMLAFCTIGMGFENKVRYFGTTAPTLLRITCLGSAHQAAASSGPNVT